MSWSPDLDELRRRLAALCAAGDELVTLLEHTVPPRTPPSLELVTAAVRRWDDAAREAGRAA